MIDFQRAFETRSIEEFINVILPTHWAGIGARIIESGVEISEIMNPWAPRWSKIPPTVKVGKTELETQIKSCMFRFHDCIHQLWGLPIPGKEFSESDFYIYKRAQMCGEVAVLTLTEFCFGQFIYDNHASEEIRSLMLSRNAIPMLQGPLQGKTPLQLALRMDDILHKKSRPKWLREHKASSDFADDYVAMLESDRMDIDHNWKLMKEVNWRPVTAPHTRYNANLDGLELTSWMINDFFHLMDTDDSVDVGLRDFNRNRRKDIVLPVGWHIQKQEIKSSYEK